MAVKRMTQNNARARWRGPRLVLGLITYLGCAAAWGQSVTFNLKDAEISTVVATIAEVTGRNFIVDPRVKGKATVISSRPMSKDEAYQVFLSLLEVHGFAAVPAGSAIKILPDVNAKQSTTPVGTERQPGVGDEVVTRVVDVEHVSAAQLVPILRPLVPQQGHLVAYQPTNVLIISDRAGNIQRLIDIIRRIDRASPDSEVEVVALNHASAAEVVRVLTSLMQQEKRDPAQGPMEDQLVVVADERTNSVLLGGDPTRRMSVRALIAHLDTPMQTEGNINVVYLRYAKAKDLVPVLTGIKTTLEEEKKQQKGKEAAQQATASSQIQADEATNALVITAPYDVFRSLQAVIRKLDIRRAQVSVEAIIAEITSRRASELGVQWLFDGTPSGDRPVGAVNFSNGTSIADVAGAVVAADQGDASAAGSIASAIAGGLTVGVGKFNSNSFNFAALVRALEGDSAINVLSTPSILTLDNVEAEIKVGQKVPFVTGSYTSIGGGGAAVPTSPFQTINREDVGITLKVTPQINEGDAIKLEISQEVSSLAPSEVDAGNITNQRSIKTTVLAADGQTVVLGGLISDDATESMQKVPLLGDIPLLGALFRYKNEQKEKRNLMVFIHPTILPDAAVTTNLTNSKYNYIRSKQLDVRRQGHSMLDVTESPLLPPPEVMQPSVLPTEQGGKKENDEPLDPEREAPTQPPGAAE